MDGLVGNRWKPFARACAVEDALRKAAPLLASVAAEQSRRPDDDGAWHHHGDELLAFELRLSVNTQRAHLIAFQIWTVERAAENEVGREMDEAYLGLRAGKGDVEGSLRVDLIGGIRFCFGTVDR